MENIFLFLSQKLLLCNLARRNILWVQLVSSKISATSVLLYEYRVLLFCIYAEQNICQIYPLFLPPFKLRKDCGGGFLNPSLRGVYIDQNGSPFLSFTSAKWQFFLRSFVSELHSPWWFMLCYTEIFSPQFNFFSFLFFRLKNTWGWIFLSTKK